MSASRMFCVGDCVIFRLLQNGYNKMGAICHNNTCVGISACCGWAYSNCFPREIPRDTTSAINAMAKRIHRNKGRKHSYKHFKGSHE
ncbi:hypothetical protein OSTOST_20641 [Ostertagia ostertagi]